MKGVAKSLALTNRLRKGARRGKKLSCGLKCWEWEKKGERWLLGAWLRIRRGRSYDGQKNSPPPICSKEISACFYLSETPLPPFLQNQGREGGGGPDSSVSSCLRTYAMLCYYSFFFVGKRGWDNEKKSQNKRKSRLTKTRRSTGLAFVFVFVLVHYTYLLPQTV